MKRKTAMTMTNKDIETINELKETVLKMCAYKDVVLMNKMPESRLCMDNVPNKPTGLPKELKGDVIAASERYIKDCWEHVKLLVDEWDKSKEEAEE